MRDPVVVVTVTVELPKSTYAELLPVLHTLTFGAGGVDPAPGSEVGADEDVVTDIDIFPLLGMGAHPKGVWAFAENDAKHADNKNINTARI
jgi:hypothetical protein